jgi:hypothetical protein
MITEYHPSYAARARDLCMAGCTELEIAQVMGISVGMLRAWRAHYSDFDYAWTDGTILANTRVIGALFKSAIGYDVTVWKETKDGIMQEKKHIEGKVAAQMAWLTNKLPEQWTKAAPDLPAGNGTINPDNMSDAEAARRVAFVLAKALYEQGNEQRGIEDDNADVPRKTK